MEERSIYGLIQVHNLLQQLFRSKLNHWLLSGRLHSLLRGRYDRVYQTGRGWYTLYSRANATGIYELASLNKTKVLVAYLQGILRRDLAPKTP